MKRVRTMTISRFNADKRALHAVYKPWVLGYIMATRGKKLYVDCVTVVPDDCVDIEIYEHKAIV